MKKVLENCSVCGEETWHMVGKKQGHSGDRWHTRRTTSECTVCGRKEINNRENGKRIISRKNESPCIKKANVLEDKE